MDFRGMDYRERYKLQYGYTDEMLKMDALMEIAATKNLKVRIVSIDGTAYEGIANHYCKADDEEDGFASVCVDTNDGGFGFPVNYIQSIEVIE